MRGVHHPDLVIGVQQLAGAIARHLGLPSGNILVTFSGNIWNPGRVELSNQGVYVIELHSRYQDDRADIPAILAHEITHVFLHRLGLAFSRTHDNEILTDTVAAYLGIGWLCLDAYQRNEWYSHLSDRHRVTVTSEKNLGYLTPEEFGYVLAKRASVFKEAPNKFLMSQVARQAYKKGWRRAFSDHRRPPLRDCSVRSRSLYRLRLRLFQAVLNRKRAKAQQKAGRLLILYASYIRITQRRRSGGYFFESEGAMTTTRHTLTSSPGFCRGRGKRHLRMSRVLPAPAASGF